MLDRNWKGRSVQKDIVEQRHQQQDAGVRVPGPETIIQMRKLAITSFPYLSNSLRCVHRLKNFVNTGAMVSGATLCVCPSKVWRCPLGRIFAIASAVARINGKLAPPSMTIVGTLMAAIRSAGRE